MRKCYQIADQRLVDGPEDTGPVVVYVSPDETEKRYLIDELKVDEHTLSSALDPDELARLEFEPNHVAVIFKRPQSYVSRDEYLFRVASTGAFLFQDGLRIVVGEDTSLFDGAPLNKVSGPGAVILRLIARAVIHFREHLRAINLLSDDIQRHINRSMENKHLISMFSLQKSLVYYVNAISSNGVLLEKLRNSATRIGLGIEESEYLDDLIIENNQCLRQAEMYSNILASLMDARASIVSNNLNALMKTLNVITIAIMVPTFVVSAFSMNVRIPLEDRPYAFVIVMLLAAVSVVLFLFVWKRWSKGGKT